MPTTALVPTSTSTAAAPPAGRGGLARRAARFAWDLGARRPTRGAVFVARWGLRGYTRSFTWLWHQVGGRGDWTAVSRLLLLAAAGAGPVYAAARAWTLLPHAWLAGGAGGLYTLLILVGLCIRTPLRGPRDRLLRAVYDGLTPYLRDSDDPDGLYCAGGLYRHAFDGWQFTGEADLRHLSLRYPPHTKDGEAGFRDKVTTVIRTKVGDGREYTFRWGYVANTLDVEVLPPLPTNLAAQVWDRTGLSDDQIIVGLTDRATGDHTMDVAVGESTRRLPMRTWLRGKLSTAPHSLVIANTGGGKSTYLRHLVHQLLQVGDEVVIVDFKGSGDFQYLAGRRGVRYVAGSPTNHLDQCLGALAWFDLECKRRNAEVLEAKQAGRAVPRQRGLWLIVDELAEGAQLAYAVDWPSPYRYLASPIRIGRGINSTVVVASQYTRATDLPVGLRNNLDAKFGLGSFTTAESRIVFDTAEAASARINSSDAQLEELSVTALPPGRGWGRWGGSRLVRVQVPYTPDPWDDRTEEAHRDLVLSIVNEVAPALPADQVPAIPTWREVREEAKRLGVTETEEPENVEALFTPPPARPVAVPDPLPAAVGAEPPPPTPGPARPAPGSMPRQSRRPRR